MIEGVFTNPSRDGLFLTTYGHGFRTTWSIYVYFLYGIFTPMHYRKKPNQIPSIHAIE